MERCNLSWRQRSPVALLLPVIAICTGLSADIRAQSEKFKVYPLAFKNYPMAFKDYPVTFKQYTLDFEAFNITLPVTNMTARVDDERNKEVRFRLSGDVLFDFDEASIRLEAEVILVGLAEKIRKEFQGAPVRVEGHTDTMGSDSYNQTLSQERAVSVKRWFVETGGIPGDRIQTHGFGEKRPVAPNTKPDGTDDPQGRQQNRRVEIVVERAG